MGVWGSKNAKICSKFAKFAVLVKLGGAESCRGHLKQGFSTLGPPIRGSKNGFFALLTPSPGSKKGPQTPPWGSQGPYKGGPAGNSFFLSCATSSGSLPILTQNLRVHKLVLVKREGRIGYHTYKKQKNAYHQHPCATSGAPGARWQ